MPRRRVLRPVEHVLARVTAVFHFRQQDGRVCLELLMAGDQLLDVVHRRDAGVVCLRDVPIGSAWLVAALWRPATRAPGITPQLSVILAVVVASGEGADSVGAGGSGGNRRRPGERAVQGPGADVRVAAARTRRETNALSRCRMGSGALSDCPRTIAPAIRSLRLPLPRRGRRPRLPTTDLAAARNDM